MGVREEEKWGKRVKGGHIERIWSGQLWLKNSLCFFHGEIAKVCFKGHILSVHFEVVVVVIKPISYYVPTPTIPAEAHSSVFYKIYYTTQCLLWNKIFKGHEKIISSDTFQNRDRAHRCWFRSRVIKGWQLSALPHSLSNICWLKSVYQRSLDFHRDQRVDLTMYLFERG